MKTLGLALGCLALASLAHATEYRIYDNDGKNAGVVRETSPNTWTRYRPDWKRDGTIQRNPDGSLTEYDNASKRIRTYRPTSKPTDPPAERRR